MKKYLSIIATLFCTGVYAQDPNFSQFQNSPLTLNPAMAGLGEDGGRLSANFRHTWIGNATPFSTGLISYDAAIMRKKISENDRLGIGVLALYDQSNGGALKASTASLTAAYNKGLNASGSSSIGFGFQAIYVNRRLDYSRLSFEDQFGSGGFDLTVPSYDMGAGQGSKSYFDFNVGAIYRMQTSRLNSYIGGTITHLAKPSENFQDVSVRHGAGFSVNAGGTWELSNDNEVSAHLQYRRRNEATEESAIFMYGLRIEDQNGDEVKVFAGAGIRVKDAWFPYVGLEYNRVRAGLSYDVSWPTIKTGSISKRSIEFSVIFNFRKAQ